KRWWSFTPIRNISASWRTICQLEKGVTSTSQAGVQLSTEVPQFRDRLLRGGKARYALQRGLH
ncbi:hypothetical protein, partial [Streptomyces mirabilis]